MTKKKADIPVATPEDSVTDQPMKKDKFEVMPDGSILVKERTGLERISGTTLAECLGLSEWGTPFTAACKVLDLYKIPMNDKMRLGRYLEPKIIDFMRDKGYAIDSAKDLFGEDIEDVGGDYSSWKSHFDHPIFGGHIDGLTADGKAIVEIKTTARIEWWTDAAGNAAIPLNYYLQASLYARMMEVDKIIFIVAAVEPGAKPQNVKLDECVYFFEVDPHPQIDEYMDAAAAFYNEFIQNGITPPPTPGNSKDEDCMREVRTIVDTSMQAYVDQYHEIKSEIDRITAAYLGELDGDLKQLGESIKGAAVWGEELKKELPAADGTIYNLTKNTSTSFDKDAMAADGVLEKYAKYSEFIKLEQSRKGVPRKKKGE